ncbi:12474_t:CDS:2 [Ambispora leptoticha]|uniref:12474_t:CDS:1 n=1 Tax=Ambispora leptoticha TaxID=144679 RepID=A0A9N8YRF9_9GLOM|nr:12474_t:CDS:2 [Ambispora leptoticha]
MKISTVSILLRNSMLKNHRIFPIIERHAGMGLCRAINEGTVVDIESSITLSEYRLINKVNPKAENTKISVVCKISFLGKISFGIENFRRIFS